MTLDPFSPQSIAQAVSSALGTADVTIPDGKRGAILTSYDGKDVRAVMAMKLGNVWTIAGDVDWHGGEPQFGIQAHASW